MKKHMEFGTRRAIRDVLRQIRVGTLELEEGRMRLRGMSTLLAFMAKFNDVQLAHRVISFLITRELKEKHGFIVE